MANDEHRDPTPTEASESSSSSASEVSKEDADRLKPQVAGEDANPGKDPEDNPDLEGEDRFDAG